MQPARAPIGSNLSHSSGLISAKLLDACSARRAICHQSLAARSRFPGLHAKRASTIRHVNHLRPQTEVTHQLVPTSKDHISSLH